MRVLSWGAGVQSSTLLAMAANGDLQVDRAVFADTKNEPKVVYDWMETMMPIAERAGIPVDIVSAGDLAEHILHGEHAPSLPVFTLGPDGRAGILGRQCTRDYKVRPIRRHLQKIRSGQRVEMLLGISLDEAQRMRDSDVQYIRNLYPLIDLRMTRDDCLVWLERHGYPKPPKSACSFCPYRSDRGWREMRDSDPEAWEFAVEFDLQVRNRRPGFRGAVYLHPSLQPLGEVDLRPKAEKAGQMNLFEAECLGMCGV